MDSTLKQSMRNDIILFFIHGPKSHHYLHLMAQRATESNLMAQRATASSALHGPESHGVQSTLASTAHNMIHDAASNPSHTDLAHQSLRFNPGDPTKNKFKKS